MKLLGVNVAAEHAAILSLGGIVGLLFGVDRNLIKVLMFLIICDFITGVIASIIEKKLSSDIAFKGIARKVVELVLVSVGHQIDFYIFKEGDAIMTALAFLFIASEGISLLENSARLGVPIPKKLLDVLVQLKVSAGGLATNKDLQDAKESTGQKKELNDEVASSDGSTVVEDEVTDKPNDILKE